MGILTSGRGRGRIKKVISSARNDNIVSTYMQGGDRELHINMIMKDLSLG